jgi:group II intron reverse transcriptase/maturase
MSVTAQKKPQLVFNNLMCQLKVDFLRRAFHGLSSQKARGVDGVSKAGYAEDLEANLCRLEDQLHRGGYRPLPARRVLIPKANGGQRALAISAFQDKIVQKAVADILQALYEPLFEDASVGFRPDRGCHMAVHKLYHRLKKSARPFVVDVDIEKFFDSVDHERLMEILQKRISDQRFLRLIRKLLRAGILIEGQETGNTSGTPQGSIVSPILANIYLHEVLDQWFAVNYASHSRQMIRYADDVIFCFSQEGEAREFYQDLVKRLETHGLRVNTEKSRIVSFRSQDNQVFHFLGFTFYWGKDRKHRRYLRLKTQAERLRKSVSAFKVWIKENRNRQRLKVLWEEAKAKLRGHYAYYGVTTNTKVHTYYFICTNILLKWLNRRSQKHSMSRQRFLQRLKQNPLPRPWGATLFDLRQGIFDYAI